MPFDFNDDMIRSKGTASMNAKEICLKFKVVNNAFNCITMVTLYFYVCVCGGGAVKREVT